MSWTLRTERDPMQQQFISKKLSKKLSKILSTISWIFVGRSNQPVLRLKQGLEWCTRSRCPDLKLLTVSTEQRQKEPTTFTVAEQNSLTVFMDVVAVMHGLNQSNAPFLLFGQLCQKGFFFEAQQIVSQDRCRYVSAVADTSTSTYCLGNRTPSLRIVWWEVSARAPFGQFDWFQICRVRIQYPEDWRPSILSRATSSMTSSMVLFWLLNYLCLEQRSWSNITSVRRDMLFNSTALPSAIPARHFS